MTAELGKFFGKMMMIMQLARSLGTELRQSKERKTGITFILLFFS
jgi:hypothetical protein